MAKSLAVINKDMVQHYRLANLLSPPEAIELTQLHDQMGEILQRQPKNERDQNSNLDTYFKMLFKYMKLLNFLKFGESKEDREPQRISQETQTEPTISGKILKTSSSSVPQQSSPIVLKPAVLKAIKPTDKINIPVPDSSSNPLATKIDSSTPDIMTKTTTFPMSSKPVTEAMIKSHLDSLLPGDDDDDDYDKQVHFNVLKILKQNDPSFQIISESPVHEIQIRDQIVSTKMISDLLNKLENPNFTELHIKNADELNFFLNVFVPSITTEVTKRSKDLLEALPGFGQYIQSQKLRVTRPKLKTGTGRKRIPDGKVHLQRWQKHIR